MDEYIKREDAIKAITWNGLSEPPEIIHLTLLTAQKNIRRISTADVVPKSEVESLKEMLEATIAGQETLQKALAKAKSEVAREIFEEIEEQIDRGLSVITKILNAKGGRANGKTVLLSKYDVFIESKKYIAELKKKYTEEK